MNFLLKVVLMANLFAKILSFFRKSGHSVLGIDIGSSYIKLVELQKKGGRVVLLNYGEIALGPYAGTDVGRATSLPAETLAVALRDLLKECHTPSRNCGIAIPLSSSLVSIIEIPSADPRQIEQMVPIEARKYIPVPISEVALEWSILPIEERPSPPGMNGSADGRSPGQKNSVANASKVLPPSSLSKEMPSPGALPGSPSVNQRTPVLIAAIHNQTLAKFADIVKRAVLASSFLEIEIWSTIRASMEDASERQVVLDLGAGSSKIYVVDRGVVRVSHIVPRGGQDLTLAAARALNISPSEAEKMKRTYGLSLNRNNISLKQVASDTLDYIFSETNRLMASYEKRFGKSIKKVTLSGGGANLPGFFDLARESIKAEVVRSEPFLKAETPAFLSEVLRQAGPEFAVAMGVALRRLEEGD